MTTIKYEIGSLLGPLDEDQVREFSEWYRDNEDPDFEFDATYLEHQRLFHGGVPEKRCFITGRGRTRMIERFLNFVDRRLDDPHACYNVEVVWTQIEERLTSNLLPFAVLYAGDMLCFDNSTPGRPAIVVWEHEKSEPKRPYLDFVAENFVAFLAALSSCPPDVGK